MNGKRERRVHGAWWWGRSMIIGSNLSSRYLLNFLFDLQPKFLLVILLFIASIKRSNLLGNEDLRR